MRKCRIFAVVALAFAVVAALAVLVWHFVPAALGSGPYSIDARPTPEVAHAEDALATDIGGYSQESVEATEAFLGVALGADAVAGRYAGTSGRVTVVAAQFDSSQDAAAAVASLARRLDEDGFRDSYRLRNDEPYRGWGSASGKRNFVMWNADVWENERTGFAWQSGSWLFAVASANWRAKEDVVRAFPY